jgi:hypothetical protein
MLWASSYIAYISSRNIQIKTYNGNTHGSFTTIDSSFRIEYPYLPRASWEYLKRAGDGNKEQPISQVFTQEAKAEIGISLKTLFHTIQRKYSQK